MNIVDVEYLQNYKDLILEQFKNAENLFKVFEIKSLSQQEIDTLFISIIEKYYLNDAIGAQLDIIGKIVGLSRAGRGDDSYRTLIKLKININASSGQPEIVISAVEQLYDATIVEYRPAYPAGFEIYQNGNINLFEEFEFLLDDDDDFLLDDGDTFLLQIPDDIDESLLFEIIPSGVSLNFLDIFLLDDSDEFFLDDGDVLYV